MKKIIIMIVIFVLGWIFGYWCHYNRTTIIIKRADASVNLFAYKGYRWVTVPGGSILVDKKDLIAGYVGGYPK